MKLHLTFVAMLLCCAFAFGQSQPALWVISLMDKGTSARLEPQQFLSPLALQRRSHACIPLTPEDYPLDAQYLATLQEHGFVRLGHSKWFNCAWGSLPSDAVEDVRSLPFVQSVQPLPTTGAGGRVATCPPTDWLPGVMDTEHDALGVNTLHCRGHRGQGIRIGLLDSGYGNLLTLAAFDSVRTRGRIVDWFDFVNRDSLVFNKDWHGTAVASRISANVPGTYVGSAPQAELALARTEDVGSETPIEMFYWLQGAEWADSLGAHIISSSLNYNTFDNPADNLTLNDLNGYTALVTRAADMAGGRGILVVVPAGNDGTTSNWQKITFPCDGDSVLCVGATRRDNWQIAGFSGRGPTADGRIKPEVVAGGQSVPVFMSSATQVMNGTSFSTPYVAGMAACLMQAHPEATAWQVRAALIRTADRFQNPTDAYGYGLVHALLADSVLANHLDDLPTQVHQPLPKPTVKVFPNPTSTHFVVELAAVADYTLQVWDAQGRCVYTAQFASKGHRVATDNWAAGLYSLRISGSGMQHTHRLVIQ